MRPWGSIGSTTVNAGFELAKLRENQLWTNKLRKNQEKPVDNSSMKD